MLWFRFQASFVGRRRLLWAMGGLAGLALLALALKGYVALPFLPISVGAALLFGAFETRNRLVPVSPWCGLDLVPGALVGALATWPFWNDDPVFSGFLALMGALVGLVVWTVVPTAPRMTEQRLRAVVDRLVLYAHAQGAPITEVIFHPYMTTRDTPIITLTAKGNTTLYEEPIWGRFRAMIVHPTLLPMGFTEAIDTAFPDGVVWKMPTSAHAQLAHAGRVAASQANSVFGPQTSF
jgi:hypothetical protein